MQHAREHLVHGVQRGSVRGHHLQRRVRQLRRPPANGCEVILATNASNCGTCGNACGTPAHTTGPATCGGGVCTLASCSAGYYNQDGQFADGCECHASGTNDVCALSGLPTLAAPGSVSGAILPLTVTEWYEVTFPSEAGKCGLHYTLSLQNFGNPVAMTVYTNCSSTDVTCSGTEATSGYTEWDWSNNDVGAPAQCTQSYPVTYYVEVFATTASSTTCMNYTLTSYVE